MGDVGGWIRGLVPRGRDALSWSVLPSAQVNRLVDRVGAGPVAWAVELAQGMTDDVTTQIPQLGVDGLVQELRKGCEAVALSIVAALADNSEVVPGPPAEALTGAVEAVGRGVGVEHLLQSVQLAHAYAVRELLAEAERHLPSSDRFAAVAHVSEVLFTIVNQLSAEMTREFSRAHAAWVTGSAAVRRELVQEVLDGKPVAADHAHRVLGYDLTRRHTAWVVWADDLEQADPGRLAERAEQLLRAGGATGTLILPVGRQRVWAWGSSVHGASVTPPTSAGTPRSGIRVAAGLPASGVEGFALSHHQALDAVRVGMLSRTDRWLLVSGWAQLDLGDRNRVWAMSWLVALGASSLATSSSRGDSWVP
ncbi:PucR family transcriptional regulator [Streptomyces sp. 3213.3]|uniref:PucR family transcriptional regulator n=1 Tax=Streptomyces sp. 3213.3 TaxID=1855348 RepID=UPI001357E799|nr:PucR family transcriptional regulator [Streptomyces sp. 3213.3]